MRRLDRLLIKKHYVKFKPKILPGPAILVIIPIFLLIGLGLNLTFTPKVSVEERASGFYPSKVTVHVGETVRFTSRLGQDFWPASDFHPNHLLYPEFDPKKPIKSGQDWTFTFTKPGQWSFHDHFHPNLTGTVVVLNATDTLIATNCSRLGTEDSKSSPSARYLCWDNEITKVVKTQGVLAALDLLARLYDTIPDFSPTCHDLAHKIGKETYDLFAKNSKIEVNQKTSYCGYGFYHGFMDQLLISGDDLSKVGVFCELVKVQMQKISSSTFSDVNCFHGVGHGIAEKHDPNIFSFKQELIDPSLAICERVSSNNSQLTDCSDGVFSSVMNLFQKKSNGFHQENLINICLAQVDRYKEACYRGAGSIQFNSYEHDFAKAASLLADIPEEKYAFEYITQVSGARARSEINQSEHDKDVTDCQNLEEKYRQHCLSGVITALVMFGPPEKEYLNGVSFCQSKVLDEGYRGPCYRQVASLARGLYTEDKFKFICGQSIEEKYRQTACRGL